MLIAPGKINKSVQPQNYIISNTDIIIMDKLIIDLQQITMDEESLTRNTMMEDLGMFNRSIDSKFDGLRQHRRIT
jgi:hypothetical protein